MAKSKSTTSSAPASVTVRYDLLELPTAQHKAGLAGLLLQIESMRRRERPPHHLPVVKTISNTGVEITFSDDSISALFNDLYDAKTALAESASKWPGATPVAEKEQIDPKGGKPKKMFVYEVVQPEGHFFRPFFDEKNEVWHKLWRDMLWTIPRGRPTTRGPFNSRAAGEPSGEGEAAWKDLLAFEKRLKKGEFRTCEVAGAIFLGAQAVNAESIPFRDRVDQALLLHFWQLTARVFVPEVVAVDGERDFVGYVLAIPEVADLDGFCRRYVRALSQLDSKTRGYRPAAAVISLPAQGSLEFMGSLARLAAETNSIEYSAVARVLTGVEFFHMVKVGNNIKTASHGRVVATPGLLAQYEGIQSSCRNPVFKQARLLALLRDEQWYAEFDPVLVERPWWLFVKSERTPRLLPSFAWDATRQFRSSIHGEHTRKVQAMSEGSPSPPASLETLVYRLVRAYVRIKTELKSGVRYESFKDKKVKDAKGRERVDYPRQYTEAQEKICSDLFLGLRSRRDDDFVSFFTGTIGSVAQGRNLSDEQDFQVIAEALLDSERRRNVQTLAMLATSAASYTSTPIDEEETNPKEDSQ